ncbi:diaminopimelate decarboxylase [Clostridium polynesiense]|uniref:diaminopimelate decarboxylase n=1 Tax=Clostridium polynesiense TaxID=1325933 RepID=UPI000590E6B1|nr:diaminopimelate decarboxylase [Clostridium polynesiense]
MKLFGTMNLNENILCVGGVKVTSLAQKYGTPLYVMDEQLIRGTCRRYLNAFDAVEGINRVAYAGKAFLTLSMCRLIQEEGLWLDVVSGGELYTAYKAGFPMEKVYFHGNNKTIEEIELGVRLGAGRFVVDNYYEIDNLNKIAESYGKVQKVLLRITPGIEAHTHSYIKTGQIDSKFGFSTLGDGVMEAVKMAEELPNIELMGIHCHIGSQIFEITPYEETCDIMMDLIARIYENTGHMLKELDLGGGFGIYYNEGDSPKSIEEYCNAIINRINKCSGELGIPVPILTIEPGRSIVGNAGITLYTVGSIKEIPEINKYVAVDGGMTDNIRPALYSAQYECIVANRVIQEARERVTISGKCCESGDILLKGISIPKVYSGDILAVLSTGAYGFSMSSNYNKIPKPAVVMINHGQERLIFKRESYEDIIKNEVR